RLMEVEMQCLSGASLLLILSCVSANAEEVGRGVLCNTEQQVERFVTLRDGGKEPNRAMQIVNEEAQSATACSYAMVIFTSDKPIAQLILNGRLVHIIQITVQAFDHGTGWKRVPDMVQYTAR